MENLNFWIILGFLECLEQGTEDKLHNHEVICTRSSEIPKDYETLSNVTSIIDDGKAYLIGSFFLVFRSHPRSKKDYGVIFDINKYFF